MSELEQLLAGLKGVNEALEALKPGMDKLNSTAAPDPQAEVPQGVQDQSTRAESSRILSVEDQIAMRKELRKQSVTDLNRLFTAQAAEKGKGIPLDVWLSAGGRARSDLFNNAYDAEFTPEVRKLLDTGGAAPVIRQDLEPVLYELFVREFPAFDMFPKEPANGLTHTYQQVTSFGDAQFMSELGTVTDDVSAYNRETTPIAILATRRGVSLKSQFATLQSGSGFNPEQLELTGGLRAIAHRMQQQIFSGHATNSGGTSANELGAYDANAFTGLRSILNTARAKEVDPYDSSATAGLMRSKWNQACVEIMNISPGRPNVIFMNPVDKEVFDAAQDQNVRYSDQPLVNVAVGVNTNTVNTVFGALPLFPVPGDSIGAYTAESSGETVRDSFLLDMSSLSLPYLGSEGITTLEIPVGVSGQLTKMYILFGMWGLAAKAPTYSNKVRITTS
jgi:hypothetical protein